MSKIVKAVSGVFSGLLGKAPKLPSISAAPVPDPTSPAARAAARKKVQARRGEGREGTIYGSYGGTNLAGTA